MGKFSRNFPRDFFIAIKALLETSRDGYGDGPSLCANIVIVGSLLVGTIMTMLTKEVLHRQNAQYIEEKHQGGFENKAYTNSSGPSTVSSMCDESLTVL